MAIKDWPKADRPREKLLRQGEQFLTDAELIAIILKTGIRGKTALDIAKEILTEHGGLKKLLALSPSILIKTPGIGQAKYAALKAVLELGRRYDDEDFTYGEILNNSTLTQKFLAERLKRHLNEVFACLFMDNHFRFISFEELFYGTIDSATVYPREMVRRAIAHNAAKVILAHNHPSGIATPSDADKEVTRLIQQALSLIDVEMIDHIIIGYSENFSFAEMGLI
ncbi:MAG TPA: DNA repair protein RadC [Gammaproteobacteria bacterium]|nr:DNA repair protein RadC [Gammaproteobacteria bacterium]